MWTEIILIVFGIIITGILSSIDKNVNHHISNFAQFGNETSDKLDEIKKIKEEIEIIRDRLAEPGRKKRIQEMEDEHRQSKRDFLNKALG